MMRLRTVLFSALLFTTVGCQLKFKADRTETNDGVIFSFRSRAGFCSFPRYNCQFSCKSGGTSQWTIAGFWPNTKDGVIPRRCSVLTKSSAISSDIQAKLHSRWPCYNCSGSTDVFWADEFANFGTCLAKQHPAISDINKYFEKAIALYEREDIYESLKKEGILPSNQSPVSTKQIDDALKIGYPNYKFELHCAGQLYQIDILQEIRICFSTKGYDRSTQCTLPKSTCSDRKVWYLESGASGNPTTWPLLALMAAVVAWCRHV